MTDCKEIHLELIKDDHIQCPFCFEHLVEAKSIRMRCCKNMKLIKDKLLVCKNCGQVHDEYFSSEYIDFYENRHKIKRKSVYHRKYHIINVMNDIVQINSIQIGYYNRENILRIFKLIDNVTQPDVGRKRLISVNFIIKQLFDILGTMVSSNIFNSFRKSFLSNGPPRKAVRRSNNIFW